MNKSGIIKSIAAAVIMFCLASAAVFAGGKQESKASGAEGESKIIIGYNAFSDSVNFSKKITDNLMENAEKNGAVLLKADTNGDPTTALANVDAFIAQGANFIVDSSWTLAAVEAVAAKCLENGIPCISIDIPVADAYFFGVNNTEAGKVGGAAAAKYIMENWDGKLDYVVLGHTEATGEEVKKRVLGIVTGVREAGVEISDANVIIQDTSGTDGTLVCKQKGTDFLTAHPGAKHILFGTINDQAALGYFSAVETSNRSADCVIVSHGADEPALENLKNEENSWIGSVGYFPERYGDYIMGMILDLAAGKSLEKNTYMENIFIDRSNVGRFYPEYK